MGPEENDTDHECTDRGDEYGGSHDVLHLSNVLMDPWFEGIGQPLKDAVHEFEYQHKCNHHEDDNDFPGWKPEEQGGENCKNADDELNPKILLVAEDDAEALPGIAEAVAKSVDVNHTRECLISNV